MICPSLSSLVPPMLLFQSPVVSKFQVPPGPFLPISPHSSVISNIDSSVTSLASNSNKYPDLYYSITLLSFSLFISLTSYCYDLLCWLTLSLSHSESSLWESWDCVLFTAFLSLSKHVNETHHPVFLYICLEWISFYPLCLNQTPFKTKTFRRILSFYLIPESWRIFYC